MYGYCTQFVVQGEGLDPDALRERVMQIAASTVVVGDDSIVRVHAHAEDPGPLLSMGAAIGGLDQINIQNMDLQHQDFMALHGFNAKEPSPFAVCGGRSGRRLRAHLPEPGGDVHHSRGADDEPQRRGHTGECAAGKRRVHRRASEQQEHRPGCRAGRRTERRGHRGRSFPDHPGRSRRDVGAQS